MSSFSIRPVGFPEREHASLEAILTIARGTLRDNWRWIAEGSADVCLVAVESKEEWRRYCNELSPSQLVACAPPSLDIEVPWRIDRDPDKLPPLRQVVQALNALGAAMVSAGGLPDATASRGSPHADTPPKSTFESRTLAPEAGNLGLGKSGTGPIIRTFSEAPVPPVPEQERINDRFPVADESGKFYDPDRYLIGIVRECLADGVSRRLSCADGGGTLLVDPERALCLVFSDNVALLPILSASRDKIQVQLLSQADLAEALAAHAQALAVNDVLFLSALLGSHGRIWRGCANDEPVRLRQWPGLGHLPNSVEYINLAAFMSGNNADVQTIAERTGMPVGQVIDFHNACMAVELLDRGGEVAVREKSINPNVRALYQKIAKRLQGEV